MGVLGALIQKRRLDMAGEQRLFDALDQASQMVEREKFKKLGQKLLESGDLTPEGLQRFAQENNLSPTEFSTLVKMLRDFQQYRAANKRLITTTDRYGRQVAKAVDISQLEGEGQVVKEPSISEVAKQKAYEKLISTGDIQTLTPVEKLLVGYKKEPSQLWMTKDKEIIAVDLNDPESIKRATQAGALPDKLWKLAYGTSGGKGVARTYINPDTKETINVMPGEQPPKGFITIEAFKAIKPTEQKPMEKLRGLVTRYKTLVSAILPRQMAGTFVMPDNPNAIDLFNQQLPDQYQQLKEILVKQAGTEKARKAQIALNLLDRIANLTGGETASTTTGTPEEAGADLTKEIDQLWGQSGKGNEIAAKMDYDPEKLRTYINHLRKLLKENSPVIKGVRGIAKELRGEEARRVQEIKKQQMLDGLGGNF